MSSFLPNRFSHLFPQQAWDQSPDSASQPQVSGSPGPVDAAAPPVRTSRFNSPQAPRPPRSLQPTFKVLLALTLLTALLLTPFAFSPHYLNMLRTQGVDLHVWLRGELYKQGTGFAALALVLAEIMITLRKRGRGWWIKLKLPGSMQIWRSLHIFLGVGLVAMVLIHTLGANGLNFNSVFLWVFWATTLTALMGVLTETGLLESSRSYFGQLPGTGAVLTKGPLVRGLRAIWLASHIFFVWVFALMLIFHIILAYHF